MKGFLLALAASVGLGLMVSKQLQKLRDEQQAAK
jgi:hypothetical protein